MKRRSWIVKIGEVEYPIKFTASQLFGKNTLQVDNNTIELKKSLVETFVGMDQPFNVGGKECRFVLQGNKADIAVDGIYLDSKKPYIPLKNVPWWGWIFIAFCIAIPFVSLGGVIPFALALLGTIYCVRITMDPYIKTVLKLLACLGISVSVWILYVLVALLL